MNYNWNFGFLAQYYPAFLWGIWNTLCISVLSIIFGSILGCMVAIGRTSLSLLGPGWGSSVFSIFCAFYIRLFLSLPVLILMMWLYYLLPVFIPINFSSPVTAIIALSLSLGGFLGDIIRGGIDAVPRSQIESAWVLGLSRRRTMFRIVLPQAVRTMLAPILGQCVTCIKLSALASVIAVSEILHTANDIVQQTYRPLETYTFVALLYFILILPFIELMRIAEKLDPKKIGDNIRWFRSA